MCTCDDNIKINFREQVARMWTGFIYLTVGTNGGLLRTWKLKLWFHKKLGILV